MLLGPCWCLVFNYRQLRCDLILVKEICCHLLDAERYCTVGLRYAVVNYDIEQVIDLRHSGKYTDCSSTNYWSHHYIRHNLDSIDHFCFHF